MLLFYLLHALVYFEICKKVAKCDICIVTYLKTLENLNFQHSKNIESGKTTTNRPHLMTLYQYLAYI